MNRNEPQPTALAQPPKPTVAMDAATVRFCGDSGDGMQLAGTQLTNTSALAGNDVATFPDFPGRDPRPARHQGRGERLSDPLRQPEDLHARRPGRRPGGHEPGGPGDQPARTWCPAGMLIVDSDGFAKRDLRTGRLTTNPLDDGTLGRLSGLPVDMTRLTRLAVEELGLGTKEADRCRNFFAMGLVFWLYDRSLEPTLRFIVEKFGRRPDDRRGEPPGPAGRLQLRRNDRGLRQPLSRRSGAAAAGRCTATSPATRPLAWGLMAAAKLSGCELFYASYPITPASDILHELSKRKNFGVRTFQAEDEIAAVTAAIGAAFGGAMGVTGTSGPGMSLKGEGHGPGRDDRVAAVGHRRAAGRAEHGHAHQDRAGRPEPGHLRPPRRVPHAGPGGPQPGRLLRRGQRGLADRRRLHDAGDRAQRRLRWPTAPSRGGFPRPTGLPRIVVEHPAIPDRRSPRNSYPTPRPAACPAWALPGTPGLMHRIGGLEKQDITGTVSYDPANHEHMVQLRAEKIAGIAHDIPPQSRRRTAEGPAAWSSAGAGPTARWPPPSAASGSGAMPWPTPICVTSIPCRPTWARSSRSYDQRADARVEPRPVPASGPGRIPGRRDRPEQDQRPAVCA